MKELTKEMINDFEHYLFTGEKSPATIEKYIRDINFFNKYINQQSSKTINKEVVISYKNFLIENEYKPRSINSMLASLNSFFDFLGWHECKAKSIKLQQQIYCPAEKELSKGEYIRLLKTAERKPKIWLIMQTICSTGIRVSELKYFTVEAVKNGEIFVNCKGKTRTILLPVKLKNKLLNYAKKYGIKKGIIFLNKKKEPINRSTIWAWMKELCKKAGVKAEKVFPHNLRKLFARTFYSMEKDIAKLADILGHSSINTTRIYIVSTGAEHRKKIERLGLII